MRVVVADDHWIVRETLRQVLRGVQGDIEVIEAETFTEVETHLRARDDIGLALGAEWRYQRSELRPTTGTELGNIIGLGYSAYEGSNHAYDGS